MAHVGFVTVLWVGCKPVTVVRQDSTIVTFVVDPLQVVASCLHVLEQHYVQVNLEPSLCYLSLHLCLVCFHLAPFFHG